MQTETINPTRDPGHKFTYVDITSVDRDSKTVRNPKRLLGRAAPSRARKSILSGDVIVSMTRPNLNAVARIEDKLNGEVCSTGFAVLRPNPSIDSEYLYLLVQSERFVDYLSGNMKGASYPAVTEGIVQDYELPLPPLAEQKAQVATLRSQRSLSAQIQEAATKRFDAANALPAALLRLAFPS